MAVTTKQYTVVGGSLGPYTYPFDHIDDGDIAVSVNGTLQTVTTHYTLDSTNKRVTFTSGSVSTGDSIVIYRNTTEDPITNTFVAGSTIRSNELNDNFNQLLYIAQESDNQALSTLGGTMQGTLEMGEDQVIKFEGATADAYETTLTVVDPTADRTITFPNVTGTVVTTGDTATVTATMMALNSVDTSELVDGAVTDAKIAANTITAGSIAANAVTASELADNAVDRDAIVNDAVNGTKIADDSINSEHYVDGSIDNAHLANSSVNSAKIVDGTIVGDDIANTTITGAKLVNDTVTATQIAANAITASELADNSVDRAAIVNDAVDGSKIAANAIDSDHYATGSIDNAHLADNSVNSAKIVNGTITGTDIGANAIDSDHYVDGSIDRVHLAADIVDGTKIADNAVQTEHITANAITEAKILDGNISTAKIADNAILGSKIAAGEISGGKIAADAITEAKIANNAVTTAKIADAELTTLAGMQSGTASILADSTALTSTTAELNLLDGKSIVTSIGGSATDVQLPTAQAVNERVVELVTEVGGFHPVANETSFPSTNPDINDGAGTIVSVKALASNLTSNGSGVATIANGAGSGNTVTINGMSNSTTYAAGKGLILETTSTLHTYTFHRLVMDETGVNTAQTLVNDFNARYRVASSAPSSSLDDGDLYFDTSVNKMKVYNASSSSWDDVATPGDFYICTFSESFDNSRTTFTVSNAPTSAQQLIISVNGVVQKPNAGTGQPSEGFTLSGSAVTFSSAPASGSDYYVVALGSTVNIGTPSNNTVSTDKLQNLAVTTPKIANDAIDATKIGVLAANLQMADAARLQIGTGNDLELYHDAAGGGYSYIMNNGPALIKIGSDTNIVLGKTSNENYFIGKPDGAVELYFDNSKKLETTSGGIEVTGTTATQKLTATNTYSATDTTQCGYQIQNLSDTTDTYAAIRLTAGSSSPATAQIASVRKGTGQNDLTFQVEASNTAKEALRILSDGKVRVPDSGKFVAGDGNDLQIYHNGSQSYITNDTSDLYIQCAGDENAIETNQNAGVKLYYNGVKQVETDANGILLEDNHRITFGDSNDGDLRFKSSTNQLELTVNNAQNFQLNVGGEVGLKAIPNGAVELYHNNIKKLNTHADGVEILGKLYMADSKNIELGNSQDLKIYHSGSHSYIDEVGDGDLYIRSASNIRLTDTSDNKMILCQDGGEVQLYHDGTEKAHTTSTGLRLDDSDKLEIGTSADLQIFHNGTNSFIQNDNGHLYIHQNDATKDTYFLTKNFAINNEANTENMIRGFTDGAIELFYDGSKKFETLSTGAHIATNADLRFANGNWTGETYGKIQQHGNYLYICAGSNGLVLRTGGGTDRWAMDGSGHLKPMANNTYDIGNSSYRVRNLYVNDAHFSNEGSQNSVDGTWGNWTLQEGEDDIFMLNNRTGKKYKIALTEVS